MSYCELCGRLIPTKSLAKTVVLEGATLTICLNCYQRLVRQGRVREVRQETSKSARSTRRSSYRSRRVPKRILYEEYEVVPDYAKRIREARMRMGWSTKVLAEKVREKENVIKRIEAGRLVPSIELARRLERVLRIKLLEPVVEETSYTAESTSEDYYTIGDLIRIKK